MTYHSRQSGFALLLTLVLVVLAGLAMAGMARRSFLTALRAQDQAQRVQREWAVRSLRTTLLGRAAIVLDEAERGEAQADDPDLFQPVTVVESRVELAGWTYDLVFTDEQSKLNVGEVISRRGESRARESLLEAVGGSLPVGVDVALSPIAESRLEQEFGLDLTGSYDQLFTGAEPELLIGRDGLARHITCWGGGIVNIRRAPAAVVRESLRGEITGGQIEQLLAARQQNPQAALAHMLRAIGGVNNDRRAQLARRLTDTSTCHGLWVVARGPQRSWYSLSIGQAAVATMEPDTREAKDRPTATILRRMEFHW